MARALTTKAVEAAKPDPENRREIPDGIVAGLYLVVQPGGAKSWALRYRHAGRPVKMTLGRWPHMKLAEARTAAAEAVEAVALGSNPAATMKATKAALIEAQRTERDLFENVAREFIERYARPKNRAWKESARLLGLVPDRTAEVDPAPLIVRGGVASEWKGRRVQEITRRDILDILDGHVDRGAPIIANRTLAALRKMMNWAVDRGILEGSPAAGVKAPAPARSRDRILNDDEIRWFWQACVRLGPPFGPLFQMLLLTGQRRDEVASIRDAEIDGATWTLPATRTKNGRGHAVPLSGAVLDALAAVERIKGEADFIFTSNGKTAVSGFTRPKERLERLMVEIAGAERGATVEISPFTLHDLRRTAASGMAKAGVNMPVVEKILNHASGSFAGVAGVYQRHDFADEKRRALETWANRVLALAGEREAGTVISLAQART